MGGLTTLNPTIHCLSSARTDEVALFRAGGQELVTHEDIGTNMEQ